MSPDPQPRPFVDARSIRMAALRALTLAFVVLAAAPIARGQVAQQARFKILHEVLATQAASRVGLPFGDAGAELSDSGTIDQGKLAGEIKKRGESVPVGKFVLITRIEFSDKTIEVEVDGGGKQGPGVLSKIGAGVQNGIGGGLPKGTPANTGGAGSKIILRFVEKAPADLTPADLRRLLNPILDFGTAQAALTGVAADGETPSPDAPKEARIGMSRNAVIQALGRPINRVRETVEGVEREDWIYNARGLRTTFVTFENDVVVGIREYDR